MSNKEETYNYTFDCINCLPLCFIAYPQDNYGNSIIIAPITETDEADLDEGNSIIIKDQHNRTFLVDSKSAYVYGALNLHPKSDDIHKIVKANLFNNIYVTVDVPSNYDYESHTVTSTFDKIKWYDTDNPELYLPFLHGKLGKPERVVIFRYSFNTTTIKRKTLSKKENRAHYLSSKDYYTSYSKRKTELKRKAKVNSLTFTIKKR